MPERRAVILAAAVMTIAAPAGAQEWSVDAQAGRVRAALDPNAPTSETFALGLRYDAPTTALRLTAGLPLSSDEYVWGSLGAWKRAVLQKGAVTAGLDLSGNAFLVQGRSEPTGGPLPLPGSPGAPSRSGHALAGQILPLLAFETATVQLQARAGVSHYVAEMGGQRGDRTVRLADLQLTYTPSVNVMILPAVRWYSAREEDAVTFAGLTAALSHNRLTAWGSAGQWLGGELAERTAWATGVSYRLSPRVGLGGSVRREVFDPLYLSVPQTSWNVGFSFQIAGRAGPPPPPVPASYVNGVATVRLPASAARTAPRVAGDFNGWTPAPMRRVGDHWVYEVRVAPGVYNYAFVDENGAWFVPKDVPGRRDDGMGGHVAVLVVR